jgi:hypothetical protein
MKKEIGYHEQPKNPVPYVRIAGNLERDAI